MSSGQARFDADRQRAALIELVEGIGFLETGEGTEFVTELESAFAPMMQGMARRMGFPLDAADVVHGAIVLLLEQDARVAKYAAAAEEEPWGYLATCLTEWGRRQWGERGTTLDAVEFLPVHRTAQLPGHHVSEELTPLPEVVRLTHAVLEPLTPSEQQPTLHPLLSWLARNPPQRLSYEGVELAAAVDHFPSFTKGQLKAVMNISWGGRPRQAETSLMGAFLLDPEFRPSDSPTRARALVHYKAAMRASAAQARTLIERTP